MKLSLFKNKLTQKGFFSLQYSCFTSSNKNELYIWLSNVSPGKRKDDYTNFLKISNYPRKLDFFDDKNPVELYMGPRHSAVITNNGDMYTFGTGNWGVLGHGNESSVSHTEPKRIEFFAKNNIKIKKASMGDFHTLALTEDGSVYSWGFGGKKGFMNLFFTGKLLFLFIIDCGALGHGDKTDVFIPKKIKFFETHNIKIKDIACGIRHSVALSGFKYFNKYRKWRNLHMGTWRIWFTWKRI
jgi:alpha-tubulin suppressor-like RCC1 family protein